MQIEDFIELFNRVYILNDLSWKGQLDTKRYISYWIPGDYIAGSGGPPLDPSLRSPRGDKNGGDEEDEEDEDDLPDPFTDNPMYPFTVTEPTTFVVSLFQSDRRWSVSRIGEYTTPHIISSSAFSLPNHSLLSCMSYSRAIGFVLVKLSGLKLRVTTFNMDRIIATSEYIQFSNAASNIITLTSGRYAIVPFTDISLSSTVMEYCLSISYLKGHLEFDVNDIIKERPMDSMPSDDENEEDEIIKKEKRNLLNKDNQNEIGKCPLLLISNQWEWKEEMEEIAAIAIYEQVNDLAYLLRCLKKDIRDLQKDKMKDDDNKQQKLIEEEEKRKIKEEKNLVNKSLMMGLRG
jgi:hypothetical protein